MTLTKHAVDLLARIPGDTSGPTDVYKLYDRHGELLYVGVSLSVAQRMGQHRQGKSWWRQVARIEVTHASSRQVALFMELALIRACRPRYNVAGRR